MKSFMPACLHCSRSSLNALAVIASIGLMDQSGRLLMMRVAATPSITGICMSIRINSCVP